MSKNKIITSAKRAVRNAYGKATIAYGSLGALATGLYLNAQRIAESYVPGGVWNAEAWRQHWGSDGTYATLSLYGAELFGAIIVLTAPSIFKQIYNKSNTRTEVDKKNKRITQTRPAFFDKNATYFSRRKDSFEYDAILSVSVNQRPLQRKANTGDLEIKAICLDHAKDTRCGGNSTLKERVFTIPYQKAPFDLREKFVKDLPKHETLKEKLRAA